VLSRLLTLLQGWWDGRHDARPQHRIEPTVTYRPTRQPR